MRPTVVVIFLMLIHVIMATRCIIEEKVRRYRLVLPGKHVVRKLFVNQDTILIPLDRSVAGRTGDTRHSFGRRKQRLRE